MSKFSGLIDKHNVMIVIPLFLIAILLAILVVQSFVGPRLYGRSMRMQDGDTGYVRMQHRLDSFQ